MFGKGKEELESGTMETILGAETQFQGTIRSKGYIRVDGRVEGGIFAEGVIIGQSAEIQGDVTAKNIVIGGKVTGNVIAAGILEIQKHSQIIGDIRAAQLSIAEGAVFEGNCVMAAENKSKVIDMDEVMAKSNSGRA